MDIQTYLKSTYLDFKIGYSYYFLKNHVKYCYAFYIATNYFEVSNQQDNSSRAILRKAAQEFRLKKLEVLKSSQQIDKRFIRKTLSLEQLIL